MTDSVHSQFRQHDLDAAAAAVVRKGPNHETQ